jgi:pSer/pThr/pTyr-binding forkhead associated (FHA) protein
MIVSLEAKSGPSAGKGVRLQSGQSIRVGRTAKSDFVVSEDSHLSGVHFAIELEESSCRIKDLNSRNGTLLNGQRITAGVLQDGDTITAGETTFRVTVEQAAVVAPASGPASDPKATPQQRLLALLRNDCQPLYAVLDTARDIKILALLTQSKEKHQSLYEGVQGAKLSQVAPYLVRLDKDSLLLGSLLLEGWGNNWGVYLTCTSDFPEVRRHLRHFLEVQLPDGKQVYFRFYDPRVLRVFLPTCTADEVNQFFGPIKQYLMEDEKPDKLLQFSNTGRGADKKVVDLSQTAAADEKRPASPPGSPTLAWLDKPTPDQQR